MSTAFHPQTDGQTERANRTLEEGLRSYVSMHHDDWDTHLPLLEFAVNNSASASSGTSPFYLNYGQHPLLPIDQLNPDTKVENVQKVLDDMKSQLTTAKEHLLKSQASQAKYANMKRRDVVFQVGEKVMLSTKHLKFTT